jgi:hypothetical protein
LTSYKRSMEKVGRLLPEGWFRVRQASQGKCLGIKICYTPPTGE